MKDLNEFKQFIRKKENIKIVTNKIVWNYTRVSTSPQMDNFSLENQEEAANKLAVERGYKIERTFGQRDESAASDDDRKEFNEFLSTLRKARVKPYAVLVWTMSRFSRTGGGGVGIYGQGSNGTAAGQQTGNGGGGGSSGTSGGAGGLPPGPFNGSGGAGGSFGGGGGAAFSGVYDTGGAGSGGAVRIIWGAGRSFPSTNTGDQ